MQKIIVILILIAILGSLGTGLFYMMKDSGDSDRMVKALTWRIALSLILFVFLIGGYYVGWFQPNIR
ncbi:MAG: twin transmembrane helix small protein [Gammaproteobacteria bacterium]|nr:MAG: twin transmembrane helix small protein [Gammaproteobacteria bacterium]